MSQRFEGMSVIVSVDSEKRLDLVNQTEASAVLLVGHQGKFRDQWQHHSALENLPLLQQALDQSDLEVLALCRAGHEVDADILGALKFENILEYGGESEFGQRYWLNMPDYAGLNVMRSVATVDDFLPHFARGVSSMLLNCHDINQAITVLGHYNSFVESIVHAEESDFMKIAKHYNVGVEAVTRFIHGGFDEINIFVQLADLSITDAAMLARLGASGLVLHENIFERANPINFINGLVNAFNASHDPVRLATICATMSSTRATVNSGGLFAPEKKFDISKYASSDLESVTP